MFLYLQLLNRRGGRELMKHRAVCVCVCLCLCTHCHLSPWRYLMCLTRQSCLINYHIISMSWHLISVVFYFHYIVLFLMLFLMFVKVALSLLLFDPEKIIYINFINILYVQYLERTVTLLYGSCTSAHYFNISTFWPFTFLCLFPFVLIQYEIMVKRLVY